MQNKLSQCWWTGMYNEKTKLSVTQHHMQVCTFHDGCKQGIDQQIFNRKSISRKITHPQSLFTYWIQSLNKDWGCVILHEINFLLKICWSIPCLHPSWKVHTWIEICANLNHRKQMKTDGSRLIPRKHTETLVLLSVNTIWFIVNLPNCFQWNWNPYISGKRM